MNNQHHIGIGISAGIAGYKMVDLITRLKAKKMKISVIMTDNAIKMFGLEIFEKAANTPVFHRQIPQDFDYRSVLKNKKVEHIALADSLDLLVIAPATANFIAKLGNGIADDYLTTLALSVTCQVLIAPSMNTNMWYNSTTQENLRKLIAKGYYLVKPDFGDLACGYQGIGRLKNTDELETAVLELLKKRNSLKGKKILVTAGGTSVSIDAVREITNRASGKMGKSLAEVAFKRGAEVLLLRAENAVVPDLNIKQGTFRTVEDLSKLLVKYCRSYDIIFHSAAVSDFYLDKPQTGKMDSSKTYSLTLVPTEKLIDKIKKWNPKITLVGFKAVVSPKEEELERLGVDMIKTYNADYVVINDVGRNDIGFGSDYNEVYLLPKNGQFYKSLR